MTNHFFVEPIVTWRFFKLTHFEVSSCCFRWKFLTYFWGRFDHGRTNHYLKGQFYRLRVDENPPFLLKTAWGRQFPQLWDQVFFSKIFKVCEKYPKDERHGSELFRRLRANRERPYDNGLYIPCKSNSKLIQKENEIETQVNRVQNIKWKKSWILLSFLAKTYWFSPAKSII